MWYTMKNAFKYKKALSPIFPLCMQQTEDFTHVLLCPSARNARKNNLVSLKQRMKKVGTSDIMTEYILTNVRNQAESVQGETPMYPTTPHKHLLWETIQEQTIIGWEAFQRGFLTQKWNKCHELWVKESNQKENTSSVITTSYQK